ncbi:unnamed protein product [Prorocentrum cordatum]|uniref:Uncharacterized protein n=1 Tax=Prorocentrum cordatum TaxID=2364126 RepID=A0ABN9PFC4_9DINO|nr:unnamed protein product [Polarella glacialis]
MLFHMARHRTMLPVAVALLSFCVLPWCRAIKLGADSFAKAAAEVHMPRAPEAAKWLSWWLEGNRSQMLTLHDLQVSEDTTAIVTHAGKNNQEFIDMAVMLGVSLTRHMPDHLRIALGIKGMTDDNQAALKEAGWHVVLVADWRAPAYSFNSCGESCIDDEFMVRHQDSFERLNAFRLPVGRVLAVADMDADTYVASGALGLLLNSSQTIPRNNIGMVPNGCDRGFSSGVMLFKPSLKKYLRMVFHMAQVLTGNASKRNDEQIINALYEGKISELDSKFNCMSPTGVNLNHSCQKRCAEVVVSHFTGLPKPARADVESFSLVRGTAPSVQRNGDAMSRFYCDLIDSQALLTRPLQRIVSRADACCHTPALESDPPACAGVQEKCPAQVLMESSEREQRAWLGVYNRTGIVSDADFNGGRPIYAGPGSYFLYRRRLPRVIAVPSGGGPQVGFSWVPLKGILVPLAGHRRRWTWAGQLSTSGVAASCPPREGPTVFVEKKGNWMVGLNHSKDIAEGYSHKRAPCPQEATEWKHLSPTTKDWVPSKTRLSSFGEPAPLAAPMTAAAGTSPSGPPRAPSQLPSPPAAPAATSLAPPPLALPAAPKVAHPAASPGGFPGGFPGAPSGGLPAASSAEADALMKRWIEEAAKKSVTAPRAVPQATPAAAPAADPPVARPVEAASSAASAAVPVQAKPYAIAFYGGITGIRGKFAQESSQRQLQDGPQASMKSTVNLSIPAKLLEENLLGPTDVFIHSWSPSYGGSLKKLYNPTVAHYEVNEDDMPEINAMAERLPHGHWSGGDYPQINHVSMVRSLSKVLQIIDDYQEATGHVYDSVFLCRPDVLLKTKIDLNMSSPSRLETPGKNQRLAAVSENAVFYTSGISGRADFHYLMSGRSVKAFSTVYDSLPSLTKPIMAHSGWMQEFLSQKKLRPSPSDTIASTDEEVYRKVPDTPEWRAVLAPLMPPQCIDQLVSHNGISDDCLVDM